MSQVRTDVIRPGPGPHPCLLSTGTTCPVPCHGSTSIASCLTRARRVNTQPAPIGLKLISEARLLMSPLQPNQKPVDRLLPYIMEILYLLSSLDDVGLTKRKKTSRKENNSIYTRSLHSFTK